MTDEQGQAIGTPDQGTATPEIPAQTQAQPANETPVTPSYVTKEELEKATAEIIRRVQQSNKDRQKQVNSELDAIKNRLSGTGVQLSQEQEQALRGKISDDLDGNPEADVPASTTTPEIQAQIDYVFSQIEDAFSVVGQKVTENDPEWKQVEAALNDPKGSLGKTISAATQAAALKKQRTQARQAGAEARVTGAGGSAGSVIGAPRGSSATLDATRAATDSSAALSGVFSGASVVLATRGI